MVGLDVRFQATAASGQLRQALIGYMVMAPSIIGDQVTISGVTTSGAAFATEIQNYCAGGSFLPNDVTGCTGSRTGTLLVLGNGTDMTALSTVTRLNVVHDFTLDAGSGGSVTGGLVSDRFTLGAAGNPGIPEPQTYVMVSSAILALVGLRRLKSKARTIGGQNENA